MPSRDNIKITKNLDVIKEVITSESMLNYIENHGNSEYILIYKYLTHSDLATSWKRNEKQWLDHNLLNYLSVSTMEDMQSSWMQFETAHQSCITLPKIFTDELWIVDRATAWRTVQYNLEEYANIYLVNDTLEYFTPQYTKQVFDNLWKEYRRWDFDEYALNLDDWDFTRINLTWAAHWIWTARDTEFHKLRRSLFRTDTLEVLIEKSWDTKNIFIMLSKNPKFFTVLWIRNDRWLRLTEIRLNRLRRQISRVDNLWAEVQTPEQVNETPIQETTVQGGTTQGLTSQQEETVPETQGQEISNQWTSTESKTVSRAKQSAWRKQLAEEMMNYTVHDNEVFCPLTWIRVNFDDAWTLLRASHIKAYKDSNENEKYDINNWILMCANADALFDKHLFTIGEDGELIFSELIKQDSQLLRDLLLSRPVFKEILNPQRLHYLEEHRRIFEEKERIRLAWNEDIWDSEEVVTDYLND